MIIASQHILGHSQAEDLLFANDRNKSRSFLLEGQRGIGKAALAYRYAASVLNSDIERLMSKSHPDLFVLERRFDEKADKFKKEISIDDARDMRSFLSRTPAEGTHRVVIIDSADELRMEAANCILKVVEEPPKNSVMILLSHGGFVLPTIRSRCTAIRMQPLPEKEMCQVISLIMSNVHESDVKMLCTLSEGSPGVAKMIYENEGLWITGELAEIFHRYPKSDYLQMIKFAERVAKQENGWPVFGQIFIWYLTTIAKAAARGQMVEVGNVQVNPNVKLPALLDEIATWQENENSATVFNLDHKQVIVNTLLKMSECFS